MRLGESIFEEDHLHIGETAPNLRAAHTGGIVGLGYAKQRKLAARIPGVIAGRSLPPLRMAASAVTSLSLPFVASFRGS